MVTRQELRDCLRELIVQAAEAHQTDLAIGNEVSVPLSGVLATARPNAPQLSKLLVELNDTEVPPGLAFRLGWEGDLGTGQQVILLRNA